MDRDLTAPGLRSFAMLAGLALASGCEHRPALVMDDASAGALDAGPRLTFEDPPPDPVAPLEPVVSLPFSPPPISGGTLTVLGIGRYAVASDPDRDRVFVADLSAVKVAAEVALLPGDEPGRIVEDGAGRPHVVLRGGHALLTLDPTRGWAASRREICPLPRGIAHDGASNNLWVACAGGELMVLSAEGGLPLAVIQLEDDLRDVVLADGMVYVSRFRSAVVLVVDPETRKLARKAGPPAWSSPFGQGGSFTPSVAWRMVANPRGTGVVMAHQRGRLQPVSLATGGYGGGGGQDPDPCGQSIVHSTVSLVRELPGQSKASSLGARVLPQVVLPVDVAVAPGGREMAVVSAGSNESSDARLVIVPLREAAEGDSCGVGKSAPIGAGEIVAAAYLPSGKLIAQTREPAAIVWANTFQVLPLSADSRFDTGHRLFHASVGVGIACASCHPEGGEDGRVWSFEMLGPRRTPTLRGGLLATAPFHWDGDLSDMSALVKEVMVRRMGGDPPGAASVDALAHYLDRLPHRPRPVGDAQSAARGEALFRNPAVGCADCHSGPRLTNNTSGSVGTHGIFQVPSLLGVGERLPLMHDGCATTMGARFTPWCGGDRHGHTAQLTTRELGDLIEYLNTL